MNKGRVLLREQEEAKWEARRQMLSQKREVAGLFRGWKPSNFDDSATRILYVGKCTSGPFDEEDVVRTAFNGSRAFWDFARDLAKAAGCSQETLDCVAWSNISKISLAQVKAEDEVLAGFEAEAAATLNAEIEDLRPHIVVFVTKQFGEQVIREVAQAKNQQDNSAWNKSENESTDEKYSDVWWRTRPDGVKILWMRHPWFADPALLNYAINKIVALTR